VVEERTAAELLAPFELGLEVALEPLADVAPTAPAGAVPEASAELSSTRLALRWDSATAP
jgi:hypothetical protein